MIFAPHPLKIQPAKVQPAAAGLFTFALLMVLFLFAGHAPAVDSAERDPMDWPNWRGPQQNRISTEKGLIESWDPDGGEGSNLLWRNTELASRSTPVVFGERLYAIVRDQPGTEVEGEKVVCADASTGEILWEHRFNVYLSEVPDTRVGWSNPVVDPETGRVYAQGVSGYFCCLEGETGDLVWDRSLHEEIGFISTYGGRTNTPVVVDDNVLTSAVVVGWGDTDKWGGFARPAHRFMCFDKATGELRWMNGTNISPYDTTYSTPSVKAIDGQATMVFGSGDGQVWGFQPRTGKRLWNFPFSRMGLHVSPLVDNAGRVFTSHSEENTFGNMMGSVVALDGSKSGDLDGTELWRHFEVMAGKSSPILVDGRLYVIDDRAKLFVFDADSGEPIVRRKALGTVMRSTPLYADGKIYIAAQNGLCYILKPTEDGVEQLHRTRLRGEDVDGSMIVSRGRIYLPTSSAMYCLAAPGQTPEADPLPPEPSESSVEEDTTPAQLQVVPFDTLLSPGDTETYKVRLFNARGQLLKEVDASDARFSVDGPGTITDEGVYTAPDDAGHETALVSVELGELSGNARIRIVPPLPWSFDFNDAEDVPLTWIGGRVRYVLRDVDGERIMVKRNVLPTPRDPHNKLGTRSYAYMGQIDLADYTIQGDVLLTEHNDRLPDAGLINCRYTMSVRGQSDKLRIDSWSPHDFRTHKMVDFDARPNKWYTMKLTVVPEGDTATVRGKIWPREEHEPSDWTIEMVDHSPNLQGSPGLYGNAYDAEIYLDNIRVTPN